MTLNYKEMTNYVNEINKYKVKCECGHSLIILPKHINKRGYAICSNCGNKVYREERDKFKDKLLKEMKK